MSSWKPQQNVVLSTLLLSTLVLVADYVTGPYIRFPVLHVVPVVLASWYHGWPLGVGTALLLSLLRLGLEWHWAPLTPWMMTEVVINKVIRMIVLSLLAVMTALASQDNRALQQQVRILSGLLPICMFCKQIRDDHGNWQALEVYITQHSEADFTHSLCPSCMQKQYGPDLKFPGDPEER